MAKLAKVALPVPRPSPPPTLGDYLTVGEAARVLGVSPSTLRRWDRAGRVAAVRHPVNGYRLYRREALESLLRSVAAAGVKGARTAGTGGDDMPTDRKRPG